MSRSVPEWIGKTDDTRPPQRVLDRIFIAHGGRCAKCTRKIGVGFLAWDADHILALINGGENRESNYQPLCNEVCHPVKTKADVAEKARNYRKRSKLTVGTRSTKPKFQGRGFQRFAPQRTASRPIQRKSEL